MNEQVFKLFVSAESETSKSAIAYIKNYIAGLARQDIYLEVFDVAENYEDALAEKIFTTPTLIWKSGGRKLRFIGEITDLDNYLP